MIDNNFELLRRVENKNKHKCNRINNCECIIIGELLIENLIQINNQNPSFTLLRSLEKYFMNPDINLPFKLFIKVIKFNLANFNYTEGRSLLENYMVYSSIKNSNLKMDTSRKSVLI